MATGTDRTVHKVAFCTAVFAGVAYVGYSYVKDALRRPRRGKRSQEDALLEYDSHRRNRIYLRRLSGSDATSILLGNGSSNGDSVDSRGRFILRPMSVQQRIRELNLRARHFAETIMAVQLYDTNPSSEPFSSLGHTTSYSLQPSPSHTPRTCIPIDYTNLASSRCSSMENLSLPSMPNNNGLSPRWRWSRRSLRSRSPDFSSKEELFESIEAEGERLLDERESELRKRLQGFENGTTKVLTPYEAKSLVALLHTKDCETLEKALVTISNSAAFTSNQDNLREAGCILRLQHLVVHKNIAVKLAAIGAVGNMALNECNQKEMEHIVPLLLTIVENEVQQNEKLLTQTLMTLTNIAALEDWHHHYIATLPNLLDLAQTSKDSNVRMQSLRLLVNLSTNEPMVQYLIGCKSTKYLWQMVNSQQFDDQLLRIFTLLANIISTAHRQKLAPPIDLSAISNGCDNSSPADICSMYGMGPKAEVLETLSVITKTHPDEEIRNKAKIIQTVFITKS